MIHLIYVSSATKMMSKDDLLFLLKQSRDRNKRQKITGMLLYAGGNFIQVLEGSKKDVEDVYASIVEDDRNDGNIVIENSAITERDFPNWSMGFKEFDENDKVLPEGVTDFTNQRYTPSEIATMPTVLKVLYQFKEGNA